MASRILTENSDRLILEEWSFLLLEDDDGTPNFGGGRDSNDVDPIFYDWWRNQARSKIKEKVEEAAAEQEFEPSQPIREEAIEAMVSANSLAELYDLDLLLHEQAILNQLIREYQMYIEQDEDEAEFLLVLH